MFQKVCFKAAPFVIGLVAAALVLALHLMMNNVVLAWGLPAALLLGVIHLIHLPHLKETDEQRRKLLDMTETINKRFETESKMIDGLAEIHRRRRNGLT